MSGEEDIEFLPHLDYLGRPLLVVGPVEVGGKIRARCPQLGLVVDHTPGPLVSLIAEVSHVQGVPRKKGD